MDLVLILVFFLSLMFLAMIFGEKLSLFGIVDARWLTAPFEMVAAFWDMVCEIADRIATFVLEHFWWVAATVSGGVGIVLIALIMVSGLTQEAHAIRIADSSTLKAGGVLDAVPVIDTDNIIQTRVPEEDDSQLIYQYPSRNRFPMPPLPVRQPVSDYVPQPRDIEFEPLPRPLPDFSRKPVEPDPIRITFEGFIERHGHPVRSNNVDRLIQQTVLSLRNDDWNRARADFGIERVDFERPAVAEGTRLDEVNLQDAVRVIPGDQISSRNLSIRKEVPDHPSPGEFDIRLTITNADRDRMSGLIVRESLPAAWKPVEIYPRGVYRNSVVTWLVDDLIPLEEQVLTLRVRSSESGRFQSITEVSATAAVASDSRIAEPLPAIEPERSLPPVERRPDVRLTLEQAPDSTQVGEWVDAVFRIRNVGDAPAEGVKLRVNLPLDLEHHDLADTDIDRWVDAKVRRLEPGESRRMTLTVRPVAAGRHTAVAELLFMGVQLDVRDLSVVGIERPGREREELTPRPDFR